MPTKTDKPKAARKQTAPKKAATPTGRPIACPTNAGAYDPYSAPPSPDGSRFDLPTTPAGIAMPPGQALARAYAGLLEDRCRETPDAETPFKTVKLKAVVKATDGYELVTAGAITGPVVKRTSRSGRFSRPSETGGALLDLLLLGDESALASTRDELLFDAALELCEQVSATPEVCRSISDSVAVLACLRAGLAVTRFDLPPAGAPHP